MKVKIFIVILCFYQLLTLTSTLNVQCLFRYSAFVKVYNCLVENNLNINSPQKAHINSTSGTHEPDMNHHNVTVIYVEGKTIQYFPIGFEKFFPNINGIYIRSSKLKEIRQLDLNAFPELLNLDLYENSIAIIEKDLFKYNPELVEIDLSYNKIIYIDANVFDNLKSLKWLYLSYNRCINRYAYDNPKDVNETIRFLRVKCQLPEYLALETELNQLEINVTCKNSEYFPTFSQNLDEVEKEIKTSKFSTFFQSRIKTITDYVNQDACIPKNETILINSSTTSPANDTLIDVVSNNNTIAE